MKSKDLIDWMERNKMTVVKFSALTQTPTRTIQHWRKGDRRIPGLLKAFIDLYKSTRAKAPPTTRETI